MAELSLVIPVYNEQNAIESVLKEWLGALRGAHVDFDVRVVNDGSSDGTLEIIRRMEGENKELKVIDKSNSGHGQSCVVGYKSAIADGSTWIMQVDSDGQCDPKYFPGFWQARDEEGAVMGFRVNREDGLDRVLISRGLTMAIFLVSFVFIRDSNVPYRLMHRNTLAEAVKLIPESFYLSNVLLSFIYKKRYRIKWLPIGFRERYAGKSKANTRRMATLAVDLIRDLLDIKGKLDQTSRQQ
jgi:glycosyltransferase involved in cell wall biosynthesis